MDALANFDRLAMNEQIVNAIDNVIAHEDAAVGTNVETNNVPYVGPTYDRDPYETDTDQSIDGGSDDLDIDGNIIPMPMRTLNANVPYPVIVIMMLIPTTNIFRFLLSRRILLFVFYRSTISQQKNE